MDTTDGGAAAGGNGAYISAQELNAKYADLTKPASQLSAQTPMGQMGHRVDVNDLSITLAAESARRLGIAEQQVKRWERVRKMLDSGDLKLISVRDLRALLDPSAP